MNAYSLFGINEVHRSYSLENTIIINGKEINEIIIWAHYELEHGNYMTDKIILEFINEELEDSNYPIKNKGNLLDGRVWTTHQIQPIYIGKRAFRLAWYLEENRNCLWVLHCHRRHKYDKE